MSPHSVTDPDCSHISCGLPLFLLAKPSLTRAGQKQPRRYTIHADVALWQDGTSQLLSMLPRASSWQMNALRRQHMALAAIQWCHPLPAESDEDELACWATYDR